MGSGCAAFYNTDTPENANCRMDRNFEGNNFEIYAKRAITKGEQLTHTYRSIKWRYDYLSTSLYVCFHIIYD